MSTYYSSVSICGRVDSMNVELFLASIYSGVSGACQGLLAWLVISTSIVLRISRLCGMNLGNVLESH